MILNRVVRTALTEIVMFEERAEEGEGESHMMLGKSIPGRRNINCKGPEVRTCLYSQEIARCQRGGSTVKAGA